MTLDAWLAEVETDPPCGPDLEYDNDFIELATAAVPKAEQQYGTTVIPAEEPDWRRVEKLASRLIERSKDLRAVGLLACARTSNAGLAGLAETLRLARVLLETHWEAVHPRLTIDGDTDPYMRINSVSTFADPQGLIRNLRAATFIQTPVGPISVRAAEAAIAGNVDAEGRALNVEQLRLALRDAIAADAPGPRSVVDAVDDLHAIQTIFRTQLGPESVPDIGLLLSPLESIARLVRSVTEPEQAAAAADDTAAAATQGATGAATIGVGAIRARSDALRALDAVCEYLERNEPTNPAPLLIRRAQRLMTMSFIDIIRDIAPDSLNQVETITGARAEG